MGEVELKIKEVAEQFCADSPECRMERFKLLLPTVLENYKGGIIEIGAGFGLSTEIFLQTDREVIVVDAFNDGYDYDLFALKFKHVCRLVTLKFNSQDKGVSRLLAQYAPFAFAFVDGGQLKHEVIHDLEMMQMLGVKVICVDDMNRETPTSQVPAAIKEFQTTSEYKLVKKRPIQEAYLIRK